MLRSGPRPRTVFLAAATLALSSTALLAQTTGTAPAGERPRRSDGGSGGGGDRGNFNPQEMQARMMNALRERFEVTDDEEWKLISERVLKVSELRRSTGAGVGGFGARPPGAGGGDRSSGGGGGGGDQGRGQRPGGGSPELAALSSAVRDKLPDAEIKTRLERLRETRKDNEAKLAKAQEELRAVLSIRQEAIAVVFGLLP
jgi:Spy/CpxP family protein refolding chaperone